MPMVDTKPPHDYSISLALQSSGSSGTYSLSNTSLTSFFLFFLLAISMLVISEAAVCTEMHAHSQVHVTMRLDLAHI